MSSGFCVIPKLVEDPSLKRARVDNGDGTYSIRTKGDSDAVGSTSDVDWDGVDPNATVISLLKGIVNKLN